MIALCGDIEIGYEDAGSGVPVVFLHGFPLDRSLWAPQIGGLVDRCRCIAPDFRGFGESEVKGPYSMDRYADDVVALLDALGIERAVVAGLSMGGYVAFALWRRHRSRVRGLILADTRAGADSQEAREKRQAMIATVQAEGVEAIADALSSGMLGKTTREKHPALAESVKRMLVRAPAEGVIGALGAMIGRPDSTETLASIDVPTLIVVGDEDALTPPAEARAMQEAIRGSRLEVLAGAGHLSNIERPAAFTHVTSEFVGMLTYA